MAGNMHNANVVDPVGNRSGEVPMGDPTLLEPMYVPLPATPGRTTRSRREIFFECGPVPAPSGTAAPAGDPSYGDFEFYTDTEFSRSRSSHMQPSDADSFELYTGTDFSRSRSSYRSPLLRAAQSPDGLFDLGTPVGNPVAGGPPTGADVIASLHETVVRLGQALEQTNMAVTNTCTQLGQGLIQMNAALASVCGYVGTSSVQVGQMASELAADVRRRPVARAGHGAARSGGNRQMSTYGIVPSSSSVCRGVLVSVEITAHSTERLMGELRYFRYELQQLDINEGTEAAYYQLCGAVSGRALDVLRLELAHGKGLGWKQDLAEAGRRQSSQEVKDKMARELYWHLVQRIEKSVGLTPVSSMGLVLHLEKNVRMRSNTVEDAQMFVDWWRRLQFLKYEYGCLPAERERAMASLVSQGTDPGLVKLISDTMDIDDRRDWAEFMEHRVSEEVFEFITSQNPPPQKVHEGIELVQKWIEVHTPRRDPLPHVKEVHVEGEAVSLRYHPYEKGKSLWKELTGEWENDTAEENIVDKVQEKLETLETKFKDLEAKLAEEHACSTAVVARARRQDWRRTFVKKPEARTASTKRKLEWSAMPDYVQEYLKSDMDARREQRENTKKALADSNPKSPEISPAAKADLQRDLLECQKRTKVVEEFLEEFLAGDVTHSVCKRIG